ncbi:hypothetical protein [Halobellus clavatus]|jgi:hypothetical protein|uniref:Uncharacterized protein n=1 Tax=Halobellus clavatus TaxID=660517 RepID=A0A1H3H2J9_9EURY|nr:hypothetical protein [Halobellus clavatus]SDY08869.1 hypothetical protein SAMN04487946_10681 [Halobellus clavatus]
MALPDDLKEAAEEAEDLPNPRDIVAEDEEVPLEELFDEAFMTAHTDFDTFDEMVAASPSSASAASELDLIPRGEWDDFVAETTEYDDEEEFVFAVRDHWVATKLGLN